MNIQLTISLLASDRRETLGKCLASLKPLLKELDSELIVVFTGKDEETLELVRQYTSCIIPFVWCDDFSKARNAGLKEAMGEWFLYLDDDEWFEDTGEIIRFFQSGEYRDYQSACYVVRNYLDLEGKRYADTDVGRMCRLTPKTEFVFPIHENLRPFEEPNKRFSAFVHHFGYATKEKSGCQDTKNNRNLSLLLPMLEENPDSAQCCMQITQEYRSAGDYDAAIEYCKKGLALARKETQINNYELWMQANLPLLILRTGQLQSVLDEGERILRHPRTLEVGILHICLTLSDACRKLEELQRGLKYVCLYHEKLLYLQEHPDEAKLQRAAEINLDTAAAKAVSIYIDGLFFAAGAGDFQAVSRILCWFPWDVKERVTDYYPCLEEWKQVYVEKTDEILEGYAKLTADNAYVRIQKMLYVEAQGHLQDAEELWFSCAEDRPPGFQWELIEIAVCNHFPLGTLLGELSPETWNAYAETVTERKEWEEMQEFYQKIMPLLEESPFYARRLEQCFLEKMLIRESVAFPQLMEVLGQYCSSVCTDAAALYRDEALAQPEAYALPVRYRFAAALGDALGLIGDGKVLESFSYLKDAIYIYPKMSGAVGQLLEGLEAELKAPKQGVSEEFLMLGGQVKQVLRGLIDTGQWEQAYDVLGQLMLLLPGDLEALRMKQEILRREW